MTKRKTKAKGVWHGNRFRITLDIDPDMLDEINNANIVADSTAERLRILLTWGLENLRVNKV